MTVQKLKDAEPRILFGAIVAASGLSAIGAASVKIWFLEAAPILIALPLLALQYHKFRLTPLLYRLMFLHGLVLLLGAHYTYAKVRTVDCLIGWARVWLIDWLVDRLIDWLIDWLVDGSKVIFFFLAASWWLFCIFLPGSDWILVPTSIQPETQSLRSIGTHLPGLRPGHSGARNSAPEKSGETRWRLAFVHCCGYLSGLFGVLRADWVVDRGVGRWRQRWFHGIAGRRLRRTVGHAVGVIGRLLFPAVPGRSPWQPIGPVERERIGEAKVTRRNHPVKASASFFVCFSSWTINQSINLLATRFSTPSTNLIWLFIFNFYV